MVAENVSSTSYSEATKYWKTFSWMRYILSIIFGSSSASGIIINIKINFFNCITFNNIYTIC